MPIIGPLQQVVQDTASLQYLNSRKQNLCDTVTGFPFSDEETAAMQLNVQALVRVWIPIPEAGECMLQLPSLQHRCSTSVGADGAELLWQELWG